MGELLLCRRGIASMPYYMENAAVNIYSMEELCYYVMKTLYLLDKELLDEELLVWIEQEAGEKKLAKKLQEIKRSSGSLYHFAMTLLIESGYCSREELEEADTVLKELQNKSAFQRRKLRADRYVKSGSYAKAIGEYTALLENEDGKKETEETGGRVWHNLGCAYAKLFLFEEAEECFQQAYEKNMDYRSKEMQELCRGILDKNKADSETEEPVTRDTAFKNKMNAAEDLFKLRDMEGFYEMLFSVAADWKKEYQKYSKV